MKDARGDVLYVGKAQSLRHRVRLVLAEDRRRRASCTSSGASSTASPTSRSPRSTAFSEALLLEANLVKRFKPRFNVRLKDDKSYPYIKVTLADDFPRVERTRKLPNDGSRYFGPYASATERRRVDEPRPPALPVPDLHDRHQRRRASAPAAVPPVPHQALPGPVHPGDLEGRLPRRHRAGRAVPRGPPGDRWSRPCAREMVDRRGPAGLRARRRSTATRSGRSSGRWRARRWPPSPGRSSTWSASRARTTRPRSCCSCSATAR